MPLVLNHEQVQGLRALQTARDLHSLGVQLAAAFPEVPGRLGSRYPVLIAQAAERAQVVGCTHLASLARYLACWVALGAEFERKPGHEWAAALLDATEQPEGARIFQLCVGVRERLSAQPAPGRPTPTDFDLALARLDAALQGAGDLGALENLVEPVQGGARRRLALGAACDLDALDLRRADTEPRWRYALAEGQWQRLPCAPAPDALTLRALATQPQPPDVALTILGPPAGTSSGTSGGSPSGTRLRLRIQAPQRCAQHPWVCLNDGIGLREWRGAAASDIVWSVSPPAAAAPPAAPGGAPGLLPVMAATGSPALSRVDVRSCGLREQGAPLGDVAVVLSAYPGEQHLLTWRREAWPPAAWPEAGAATGGPRTPPTHVRLERDGVAQAAARWQAGFDELDRQLAQGLGQLCSAWERVSGVAQAQLHAEPRLLCGQGGLAWGWAEGPLGLNGPPFMRVAGQLEAVACQLQLRLSGTLALAGSHSRVSLHGTATDTVRATWERMPSDSDPLAALATAKLSFRQPLVFVIEAVAQDDAVVLNALGPASGALVGGCGLRQRPDGNGLQWFAELAVEPAQVTLQVHDPVLGLQEWLHPLLPALKLVDWSLG